MNIETDVGAILEKRRAELGLPSPFITPEEFPVGTRFIREYAEQVFEVRVLEWSPTGRCVRVWEDLLGGGQERWTRADRYSPKCIEKLA